MEQKVKAVFAAHPDGQETAARIARAYLAAGMEVLESQPADRPERRAA